MRFNSLTRLLFALACAWVVMAQVSTAFAHTTGLSRGAYVWRDHRLLASVTFSREELATAIPELRDADGRANLVRFEASRAALGEWLLAGLAVTPDSGICAGTFQGMRFEEDGVALDVAYACPGDVHRLTLDIRFLSALSQGHRHLASVEVGDKVEGGVAVAGATELSFDLPSVPGEPRGATPGAGAEPSGQTARNSFLSLVRMGLEHILTGYDHLLFLFGLLLLGGPLRSLVAAVSAFTVAHSFTLAIAALGVWTPGPRIVEPGIALSIAYLGIENWFVPDARGRWRITLPFGLLHGFGFAGALREIALPRAEIPAALFGFNLGVELGQLAVLLPLVPLILLAQRKRWWQDRGFRLCTAAVAITGLVWFTARAWESIRSVV